MWLGGLIDGLRRFGAFVVLLTIQDPTQTGRGCGDEACYGVKGAAKQDASKACVVETGRCDAGIGCTVRVVVMRVSLRLCVVFVRFGPVPS